MKEYVNRDWGLVALDKGELLVSGGVSWKQVWMLLEKIAELADKAEKYWPNFRKGFQLGWEAA